MTKLDANKLQRLAKRAMQRANSRKGNVHGIQTPEERKKKKLVQTKLDIQKRKHTNTEERERQARQADGQVVAATAVGTQGWVAGVGGLATSQPMKKNTCEDCGLKQPSFGLSADGKVR